jgi:hypothetical protein
MEAIFECEHLKKAYRDTILEVTYTSEITVQRITKKTKIQFILDLLVEFEERRAEYEYYS